MNENWVVSFVKSFCEEHGFTENKFPCPPVAKSYIVKDNRIQISVRGDYYDEIKIESFSSEFVFLDHYGIVSGFDRFFGTSESELERDLNKLLDMYKNEKRVTFEELEDSIEMDDNAE